MSHSMTAVVRRRIWHDHQTSLVWCSAWTSPASCSLLLRPPCRAFTASTAKPAFPIPHKYEGEKMNVRNTKAGLFARLRIKRNKEIRKAEEMMAGKPEKKGAPSLEELYAMQSQPAVRVEHPLGAESRWLDDTPAIGDEIDPERNIFAIIDINTDQHKVMKGDLVMCNKLIGGDLNKQYTFDKVMLLGTRTCTIVGRPFIPHAYVKATVEEQTKLPKVIIFKKKRRKRFRRTKGFRHEVTVLRIDEVVAGERSPAEEVPVSESHLELMTRLHSPFYDSEPGTEKPEEHWSFYPVKPRPQK
eukprot:g346.t1